MKRTRFSETERDLDHMKAGSGIVRPSASDLSNHLACHHLTSLDLAVSLGARSAPTWHSPDAPVLQERGMAHENAYLAHLKVHGVSILNLRHFDDFERESDSGNARWDGEWRESTRSGMRRDLERLLEASYRTVVGRDLRTRCGRRSLRRAGGAADAR